MNYQEDDSSPSYGETRAADIPGDRTPVSGYGAGGRRTTPPGRPTRVARTAPPSTGGATTQFCGTCGARISGAEAFCGQCGTPVGQSGDDYTSALGVSGSAPARYHVGATGPWTPARADELTEAYVPAPGYGRSGPRPPYTQTGFGSAPYASTVNNARTTRIVIGVVCLVCSLAAAVGAIILALH